MPLTENTLEAISAAYLAEAAGEEFEAGPEDLPGCERARERGWLSRELRDGRVLYGFTPAGHAALALNGLRRDHPADLN